MSETFKEDLDPLTIPAAEITLSQTFGETIVTPADRREVEIITLNHAMELLEAGAIQGFECFSTFGGVAMVQYRVRRWSAGGFQCKIVNILGQEGSGAYGLFEDPKARQVVELVHEDAFGHSSTGPTPSDMPVPNYRAI